MKLTQLIPATVTLSCVMLASAAVADVKADLETQYAAMKLAMAAHDGTALRALLAPDFQSIDISGHTESADDMIAEVAALKADPNKQSHTTLTSVDVADNTASVEQTYEMTTQKAGNDGQNHAIRLTTQSHDIWKLEGGKWLSTMQSTAR